MEKITRGEVELMVEGILIDALALTKRIVGFQKAIKESTFIFEVGPVPVKVRKPRTKKSQKDIAEKEMTPFYGEKEPVPPGKPVRTRGHGRKRKNSTEFPPVEVGETVTIKSSPFYGEEEKFEQAQPV